MKWLKLVLASVGLAIFSHGAFAEDIGTAAELAAALADNPSGTYTLTADIDFTDVNYTAGNFSGVLNGGGHTISNLRTWLFAELSGATVSNLIISGTTVSGSTIPNETNGAFGALARTAGDGAYVSDVKVKDSTFLSNRTVNQYVGGIVGKASASAESVTIENCVVQTVSVGKDPEGVVVAGGILGMNGSTNLVIRGCDVINSSVKGKYAGGIVGKISSKTTTNLIERCTVSGVVAGTEGAGGITGGGRDSTTANAVKILSCANNANITVSGSGGYGAGGILGALYRNGLCTISNCVNRGSISHARTTYSGEGFGAGGITGGAVSGSSGNPVKVDIFDCVNYGSVTSSAVPAGGISGGTCNLSNPIKIIGCANYGNISGTDQVGGIAGVVNPAYASATLLNLKNAGSVSASEGAAGGIVGYYTSNSTFGTGERVLQIGDVTGAAMAGAYVGRMKISANNKTGSLKTSYLACTLSKGADGQSGLINGGTTVNGTYNFTLSAAADVYASVEEADHSWYDGQNEGKELDVVPVPEGALADGTAVDALGAAWVQGAGYPFLAIEAACGPEVESYTVRFFDWDGVQIGTDQSVLRGGSAVPPADPVRAGHTFAGWSTSYNGIIADTDITATYTINTYTVRFFDWDGTQIGSDQTVEFESAASAPDNPEREGYDFTGWSSDYSSVTSDLDIEAVYSIKHFTVRFLDWNGTVLSSQSVAWRGSAVAPSSPSRSGYTFVGWDSAFDVIVANVDVTALYEEGTINTYTVRFLDWDGTPLSEQIVAEGASASAPQVSAREGYDFLRWSADFSNVTSDMTVTALYSIWTYTVRFLDWDGTELKSETVEWHGAATPPEDPTREDYVFRAWVGDFSDVTQNADVTAAYDINSDIYIATAEAFAAKITSDSPAGCTYHLTADIDLSGTGYEPVDFAANLDGGGHVVRGFGESLFLCVSGTVRDAVFDGLVDGLPTSITGIARHWGHVAVTNRGGRIENVSLANLKFKTNNSLSYQSLGFICGIAMDGATFVNCTVEDSCELQQRNCYSGGIAGELGLSGEWRETAEVNSLLAGFYSCTNSGAIKIFSSGNVQIGGVLARANAGDLRIKPRTIISNCVNNATVSSTVNVGGNVAGIVAQRNANMAGLNGTLELVDCANNGDLLGIGTSANYGGALANHWRLGCIDIVRFVNRGRIGTGTGVNEADKATGGASAAFVAQSTELYDSQYIHVRDSANYGKIAGGKYAAGFFGQISANTGHGTTHCVATNCANYAEVEAYADTHYVGQVFAAFESAPADLATRVYGAWNCYFPSRGFVGHNDGATIGGEDTCLFASDEAFTVTGARNKLNSFAVPSGYETWIRGRNGPELSCFADPYSPGTVILIR